MNREYSKELKVYRKAKGMSQEDMAKEIGCSYITYFRWEHGGNITRSWEIILKEKGIIKGGKLK